MNYFQNIKDRWGIESNFQFIIIFIVFGITGSMSLLISGPILDFINLEQLITVNWVYWLVRIIIIFNISTITYFDWLFCLDSTSFLKIL